MATILITMTRLAARYCHRVVVMEQGRLVEEADRRLFPRSTAPYTKRSLRLCDGELPYRDLVRKRKGRCVAKQIAPTPAGAGYTATA